jgi:SAM-dependent methyltransferase
MSQARNPVAQAEPRRGPSQAGKPLAVVRPAPERAWADLLHAAQDRYRGCGRFAWHFAGGKLGWDPVFRHLIAQGHIAAQARVLDIGCGQGLLASLLAAVDEAFAQGHWPAEWPQAPTGCSYVGIELMQRDVSRAKRALESLRSHVDVICADMTEADLPPCEVAVILDVLHYVDRPSQQDLLARLYQRLAADGRLLLRIGDMAERRGFAASQWTDRIITAVRGHRVAPTFCRPLPDWIALLQDIGFAQVRSTPMSQGTPFANVLLVADKRS